MHVADQRLYANKRAGRGEAATDAKDALLQVLAEQNADLVVHLGHVSELAPEQRRASVSRPPRSG